jgi:hypothetical protein
MPSKILPFLWAWCAGKASTKPTKKEVRGGEAASNPHHVSGVNESIGVDPARLIGHCRQRWRTIYLYFGISGEKERKQSWLPQKKH